MQWEVVLAYMLGLVLLYVVGWLLLVPLKWLIRLIGNGILGGVLLWLFNLVGGFWGLGIAINPITALVTGFFGVPGVALLLILQVVL
ncbi:MAG: pro-sigmaK processing inhibitor BofA family protein [Christensenellales bacterium]